MRSLVNNTMQWRIQGGGGVEFLGSGNCFDAPSYVPHVKIVCWLQSNYICALQSNLQKNRGEVGASGLDHPHLLWIFY